MNKQFIKLKKEMECFEIKYEIRDGFGINIDFKFVYSDSISLAYFSNDRYNLDFDFSEDQFDAIRDVVKELLKGTIYE